MAAFSFTQLTPTAFLERSARVFPDRTAVIDGDRRFTYREFGDCSQLLAGVLGRRGIHPGDRVAALCANSSTMPKERQAELKARQGTGNVIADALRVVTEDGTDVPADGASIGEIVARGNDVMRGYYRRRRHSRCKARRDRRWRRMVPHRRPRGGPSGRLHRDPRPQQGHHHLRRREHLLGRGRTGDRRTSRRARVGGGR